MLQHWSWGSAEELLQKQRPMEVLLSLLAFSCTLCNGNYLHHLMLDAFLSICLISGILTTGVCLNTHSQLFIVSFSY